MNTGGRVASKQGYTTGISELKNEEIGWSICNSYFNGTDTKWCCCADQKECFPTEYVCMQTCSNRPRFCHK